jgi:FlaA1/EpsC-like NDP-sugar epimerase
MESHTPTGLRNRHLLVLDLTLLPLATLVAFAVRFEGFSWPDPYGVVAAGYLVITLPIKVALLLTLGLYRRLWRFASISELETILGATIASGLLCALIGGWVLPVLGVIALRVPLSVLLLDALLTTVVVAAPRLVLRIVGWHSAGRPEHGSRRVLIAGAGVAGGMLARQLRAHPEVGLTPIGFVDDDASKLHHRMHGLPVLGPLSHTTQLCRAHEVTEVLIAMPRAPGRVVRALVRAAADAGVQTRTMPGLPDIISGRFDPFALRKVQIEDLLRREPVTSDLKRVLGLVTERTVLVTGAGGSIGSELCRQICALEPSRLILVGHGENSIFSIQQELRSVYTQIPCEAIIADVKDAAQILAVLERYRPYSVFHAAAHKHVPLMEANVAEAVLNNVRGTRSVAEAAVATGVEHLVLISTDKAVHPTSVMGATKRVAEQVVQHLGEASGRNFVAVRFGNVLGSRGSVVPTFLKQIEQGGPVTVTHPEMRRYFMTIPEAVQLVLQAGTMGQGGDVFVLDMGEPVRIADLAADLIRLSGKEVGKDVEIQFSGIRPGEKLYEELFFDAEHAIPTDHPKVLRARNAALNGDVALLTEELVRAAVERRADADLRALLRRLVPDYEPALAQPAPSPGPQPILPA